MSKIPHPALRGLYRGAGTVSRLAVRFRDGGDGLAACVADLGSHPLLGDESIQALVFDLDTASPLRRALERLACNPPAVRAVQPSLRRPRDASVGRPLLKPVAHESTAVPGSANDTDRVNAILAEFESTEVAGQSSDRVPFVPRPSDGPDRANVATSESSATDRSRASDLLELLARRAGVVGGLNRPVIADPVFEETTRDLLVHGRISDAALRASAQRIAGDESVRDDHVVSAVATVLAQVERRVATIEQRRSERAVDRRETRREREGSSVEDPGVGFATERVSGLRRLAMQAAAGVRPQIDLPSPDRGEIYSGTAVPRPGSENPANDEELSRRLADILRREAWRHGIDTSGVDP